MRNVYSVGQVNTYIKNMFVQDYMLQSLMVRGEVSNCKYHSSGHIYFTLKDKLSVINCVMFAGNRRGLSFTLKEGMQVIVTGNVDIYERDGRYQLYARKIILDGVGQLYEQFERLKKKLEEQGMFAPEYKQPIPPFVKTVGVVTARTGAAVRDIIQVAKRRNPYVQIILYEAIVQGEHAAESIVKGIHALEQLPIDVMIVGRGGGSIEDLWAFNEEEVAQAVFDCSIPVISAVGHETDTTIIDYVADLRAPTPSAAAELAVKDVSLVFDTLEECQTRLRKGMARKLEQQRFLLSHSRLRLQQLSPKNKLETYRFATEQAREHLKTAMEQLIAKERGQLAVYIERLKGLSPLEKINQGFSYVSSQKGNKITDVADVTAGDNINVYMKNGRISARVLGVEKEDMEALWKEKSEVCRKC